MQRRRYELSIQVLDHGLDQAAAPSGTSVLVRSAMAATALTGLFAPETQRRNAEDWLVTIWTSFQTQRLALYRELGVLTTIGSLSSAISRPDETEEPCRLGSARSEL